MVFEKCMVKIGKVASYEGYEGDILASTLTL